MEAQHGTTGDSLEAHLKKNGVSFEFFQVVHLLERILKPEAQIGRQGPASKEVIRFRPSTSLAFPTSDISSIESFPNEVTGMNRFRIETTFLGLYGITSPLPTFYTEDIIWKDQEESAVRAFLDLFHHRFISLFYRCWEKYRHDVQFKEGGKDEYSSRLFALIGLGTPGLKENSGLPSVRMLRYAGLLTQRPLSASSLEGIISDYFNDIPVTISQNTGAWTSIRLQDQIRLNRQNSRLGVDTTLGEKIFSRSGSFLLSMGPMSLGDFMTFLPIGAYFSVLVAMVKLMLQDPLEFEIELRVRVQGIPQLKLQPSNESRLGWTTWLSSEPLNGDSVRSLRLNPSSRTETVAV